MDAEQTIAEIERLERIFAMPDTRPLSARDLSAVNRRHDDMHAHSPWFRLGSGMGFAAARDRVTAHTILSVATSGRTRGIASQSIGGGRRGTRLQYRTCSIHARRYKTRGLLCGVTSRTADIGYEDQ
jgi:hypothetical protein